MRGGRAFDAYVQRLRVRRPWIREVIYDTPFGDGYMLGTFMQRVGQARRRLIDLITDVTDQRRTEAELHSFADLVAHDLQRAGRRHQDLVGLLERRAEEPPSPEVLGLLRASAERARGLIDGVLVYARAGELRSEPVDAGRAGGRGRRGPAARAWRRPPRRSRSASCPRSRATRVSCAGCCRTCSATR